MCEKYSALFIVTIVIAYTGLFTATLLNMIFLIQASSTKNDAFKFVPFPEIEEKMNKTLIMNLAFVEDISNKDYYGIINQDIIYTWRGTKVKKTTQTFEIEVLKDIVAADENCREGYKKCGITNEEEEEYLCLNLDENAECPINKILVKNDNSTITEGFNVLPFGDKYMYFSTKRPNSYIFDDFTVTLSNSEETLDSDSMENVKKYNPLISEYTGRAYLNAKYVKFPKKKDISKSIQEYQKKGKLYSQDIINDMNIKEKQYKGLMLFLGIFTFVVTAIIPIDVGIYLLLKNKDFCFCLKNIGNRNGNGNDSHYGRYSSERDRENDAARECVGICFFMIFFGIFYLFFRYSCAPCFGRELNQKRVSFNLFFVCLPTLICSIIVLIILFMKKSIYDDYNAMDYIDDFKNGELFDSCLSRINTIIILSIIIIVIFISYLILIMVHDKDSEDSEYNTQTNYELPS